jgi:prephenate dehydrogenase
MKIGIVGLGLMGGSLARALKALDPAPYVVGIDASAEVRAAASTVVDEVHAELAPLASCAIVVLCTPIAAIEALLEPVSRVVADGAIVTDVGGVKVSVLRAARAMRPGVVFVGAHPMFGGEKGGFDRVVRYHGVVAVCEDGADETSIARVASLFESIGGRVLRCTAEAHDAAVARVSHLPYITAHALVEVAAGDPLSAALAGPGFADATRLAGFDFAVQGEVARRNHHLPAAIDALIDQLRLLRSAVSEQSGEQAAHALRRRR